MATEKRTLEILAKVTDLASRPLTRIGQSIKTTFAAGVADAGKFAKSLFSVRTAISALVGGFAAFRGGQLITGIAASTDELGKLARGTGSSVDRLLALRNALQLSGIAGDRFRGLLNVLTKSIGTALNDGTSKSAKSLGRLGLTLDDLRQTDPVELFDRLAASLERFTTPQEKAAAILEIFPKATGEVELLVDVLGQGQEAFRNLVAQAKFFGGSLDSEAAASVSRFNSALDVLKLAVDKIGLSATVAIANRLAPSLERLAYWLAANGERIGQAIGELVSALAELVVGFAAALVRVSALLSSSGESIIETIEEIYVVGAPLGKLLRKIFDARDIVPGARGVRDEMAALADSIQALETQERKLAEQRDRMAAMPEEYSDARRAADARELVEVGEKRVAQYLKLLDLEKRFNEEQARGGGKPQLNESGRQERAAQLRALASELGGLATFDNLPAPPTEFAPIIKALFGADGTEGATAKVRSFLDGVGDGLDRAVDRWTDFGAAGEDAATRLLDGGLDGLSDAFADIVTGQKSAKEAFRDLAKTMLGELARIIARLLIVRALSSFLGGAAAEPVYGPPIPTNETGGVYPGSVTQTIPLRRFEAGGIVRRPTLALFGEGRASKGEAFVPLPDGRRIPVAMSGGGGTTMNITIQAMDGADVSRVLLGNRGTLRALWQHDVSHVRAVRQNVAGAAR